MGNEQSNNQINNNDNFNKYMQQQIIQQTQQRQQTQKTQQRQQTQQTQNTKNIQIYDKKQKNIINKNISREQKQLAIEREKLRQRELELKKKEYLLNQKNKEIQQKYYENQKQQQIEKQYQIQKDHQKQQQYQTQNDNRTKFNNFQKKRTQEFKSEINGLKTIRVNPLKVFELPENFTLEQLKISYKKLALKYHPDRPNGNEIKFQIITKIYLALFEDYKTKQPDKQYLDLRNGSRDFITKQNNQKKQNIHMDAEKFNLTLFNKIYDENKLYSSNDNGYGKWLQDDNAIKPPKLFSKSFNINVFNTFFNDERANYAKGREIVEYKDPEAQGTSMNYGKIGEDKINDFTSNHNSTTQYSDLKKAYTDTFLVPTEDVTRTNYKGINHLKQDRSNISFTMNETDKQRQALINDRLEKEELLRQQRVKKNDQLIENHFNKMNNLFLGFR